MKILATNKRAVYDYEILNKFEAGLVLTGQEVKSIKNGRLSLKGAYIALKINSQTKQPEAWLINAHIPPYQKTNTPANYNPERSRKLLLHSSELKSLIGKLTIKGLTLTPLRVYTQRNKIKLEFGIGRGKRQVDKREVIKQRDLTREIKQHLKIRG